MIWRSGPEMATVGVEVAAGLGCADAVTAMQCLRRIPAAELTALSQVFAVPAYGASVLPEDRCGCYARVGSTGCP